MNKLLLSAILVFSIGGLLTAQTIKADVPTPGGQYVRGLTVVFGDDTEYGSSDLAILDVSWFDQFSIGAAIQRTTVGDDHQIGAGFALGKTFNEAKEDVKVVYPITLIPSWFRSNDGIEIEDFFGITLSSGIYRSLGDHLNVGVNAQVTWLSEFDQDEWSVVLGFGVRYHH